jgi:iron complex outermembrane receptor protein
MRLALLLFLAPFLTASARGQTLPPDTSDIAMRVQMTDSVVVTASRMPESVATTGRRVAVWTQADLQAHAVTSFDQLLDVVSGVDVQSRGGFGVQSDLTLRGSTFNGVLLLLDGARLNDPMTGHFLMDMPVPLSEIVRVEVLRGPAAALYGPDALGGVVHLITRTGRRNGRTSSTGTRGGVDGRFGSDNLYDGTAHIRHASPRTTVSAAATAQGSDGSPVTNAEGERVRREDETVRTDFSRRAGTAAVAHALPSVTLYARAGADTRDFSAWHYYTAFESDKARESTDTYWTQVRLQSHADGRTQWQAQVAGKQHADRYQYNPDASTNAHTSRLLTAHAQVSQAVRPNLTLTGGLSGSLRGIDSNRYGVHSESSGGAFGSLRWGATERLTINTSARVDADAVFGVEATPQLYLSYRLPGVTLRAGGGRAVRAPNYVERFIDSGGNRGTPDLNAEQSWSVEAGFDVMPRPGLDLHVTGFGRWTDDLIDYALQDPGDEVFVAQNVHAVNTLGLEVEGSFTQVVGDARLRLTSAYTFLDATLDASEAVADYKYALTSARHLLQSTASARVGAMSASLQGLWKDRLSDVGPATDRYAVFHGRLGYTLPVGAERITLSGEVRNLFDRAYSEVFDAPLPGRTLLVGASLQW